jgi:hypothetical protein
LDVTREFKATAVLSQCRLKKKLRLLGDELQQLGIPSLSSVAANISGVAAGCNGSNVWDSLVKIPLPVLSMDTGDNERI